MKRHAPYLIAISAFAIYLNTLGNGFALDDVFHIRDNEAIRNLTLHSAAGFFHRPFYPGNLYRPLVKLSYALNFAFTGMEPFYFHFVNVVLHTCISIFVYLLLRELFDFKLSFIVSLIFAIHPIHVEAVANAAGRSELMAAFFGLASLLLVIRNSSSERCFMNLSFKSATSLMILFLLSLLSKESAVAFLPILPLTLCVRFGFTKGIKASVRPLWIMLIALSVYLFLRVEALGSLSIAGTAPDLLNNPIADLNPAERVMPALILLGKYVSLGILPFVLSSDYSYAALVPSLTISSANEIMYLCLMILIATSAAFGWILKSRPYQFFGLWFLLSFSVTSNLLFPIGTIFGERLAYLPSLGIAGLLGMLIVNMESNGARRFAAACLLLAFSLKTFSQNLIWHDNITLTAYQIKTSPESARTHFNYGILLRNIGDWQNAEYHFRQALLIYPRYSSAAFGLSTVYLHSGRVFESINWLSKSMRYDPENLNAINTLGRLFLNNGNNKKAQTTFKRALTVDPLNLSARIGLLAVYINQNNINQAVQLRNELIATHPENREIHNLSRELERLLKNSTTGTHRNSSA